MSGVKRMLRKPEASWLVPALVAGALLVGAMLLPLWKMELVAPQYPEGLVMYAYGHEFADDPSSSYLDVREINGLNHYIGMKPIEEVTEMQLFRPGVTALIVGAIAVSFVAWKRRWFQWFIVSAFWFVPVFFVADLQYRLYDYGHTMNEEAPLNPGPFTPNVFGTTEVWNFHSETSLQIGFYLMVAAALVMTLAPPAVRWVGARRSGESVRSARGAEQLEALHASRRHIP